MITAAAYACVVRDKRILQYTISGTERGAMIAWIERDCYWPIPAWVTDEDVQRIFRHLSDQKGGFVKVALTTVMIGEKT